ncbi:hypothetical protein PoB_002148800 [Plakobranchus ocellatus]|uniref:PKD domain-containing protein n=1 Tax=Plakobranchus ocellatus TaxID=259542 RepID=A0AAV3ZJJ1_9GAST|nr:hypothetical protein PoB_002148800 [Plakobranchus ocellatus]
MSNEVIVPGEPVMFEVSLSDFTSDTCVYIHWDDLEKKTVYHDKDTACNNVDFAGATHGGTVIDLLSSPISYSYLQEGIYTVEIVAEDNNGNRETLSKSFPVSYTECSFPTTSILFAKPSLHLADIYRRNKYISLMGKGEINCPGNSAFTKSWSLNRVHEITGADGAAVDISDLTTDIASLYIPTRFLPLGFYKY